MRTDGLIQSDRIPLQAVASLRTSQMRTEASLMAARKFPAVFSKRVAIRRKCLIPGSSPRASPVEEALDSVARLVEVFREADRVFPIALGRDVRPRLPLCDSRAQCVGVVALVGEQNGAGCQMPDQVPLAPAISLAWPALRIDEGGTLRSSPRASLGGEAASGAARTSLS